MRTTETTLEQHQTIIGYLYDYGHTNTPEEAADWVYAMSDADRIDWLETAQRTTRIYPTIH